MASNNVKLNRVLSKMGTKYLAELERIPDNTVIVVDNDYKQDLCDERIKAFEEGIEYTLSHIDDFVVDDLDDE